jgi:hypothetical protein
MVLPNYLAAEAETRAAEFDSRSAILKDRPSVSPFVSGGVSRQNIADTNPAGYIPALSVGVALEWNIPGPRGSYAEESARDEMQAAAQRSRQAFAQNTSRLNTLMAQITSETELLDTLRIAHENSEKLLTVLEAHRAIGSIDSLNYTLAFLNNVDAKNSMLDSWGALVKSIYEFDEYKKWSKAR